MRKAPWILTALMFIVAAIAFAVARAQTPSAAKKGPAATQKTAAVPMQKTEALPPIKRLPTAKAVVDEHMDAINHCDWTRLMAQYPDDVEFFLPGGKVVTGRAEVAELFRGFVKPVKDGGLCGLKFTPEHVFIVGDTINVSWVGNADFLVEPYRGADAYETKNGLMQAQVTTFDGAQLKLKK